MLQPNARKLLSRAMATYLLLVPTHAEASVIFDNFNPDGTFHPTFNLVAASAHFDFFDFIAVRAAARFPVSGGNFTLDAVVLPIAGFNSVAGSSLRVRLTEDAAGVPGTTIEVLSENEAIWPTVGPVTTYQTLFSTTNPLLSDGANYWIVTELTSLPESQQDYFDYRWFINNTGTRVPFRQQQVLGLPSDPWTGALGSEPVAFRVEGTPSLVGADPHVTSTYLAPAVPNPSRETTALSFRLSRTGSVELSIFSVDGRRLVTLVSGRRDAGDHRMAWDGRDREGRLVASGLYVIRLVTDEGQIERRVVRIR